MATAGRSFKPIDGTLADALVLLETNWTTNGSSTVTLTSNQKKNGLVSVTRTATGRFTVVVSGNYNALKGFSGSAMVASAGTVNVTLIAAPTLTAAAGATFTIGVYLNGSLSDLSANDIVYLSFKLSRSTLES